MLDKRIIYTKCMYKLLVVIRLFQLTRHDTYRILGILILGLTLSRVYQVSRNLEPDIPRDKVSPKNKMSNILFIGNL